MSSLLQIVEFDPSLSTMSDDTEEHEGVVGQRSEKRYSPDQPRIGGKFAESDTDKPDYKAENLNYGESTKDAFFKDGQWDPTRVATVQQPGVDKYNQLETKTPPEGRDPHGIILGGGTASGKSTLANGRFLTDDPNLVNIDADNFNLAIPEFDGLKQTDQENAAARVHEEASQMAKMAVAQAVNGRYDIVYDSTTSGQGGLNTINQLGAAGYKMDAYFVDIPLAQAFDRAATRERDSTDPKNYGRYLRILSRVAT